MQSMNDLLAREAIREALQLYARGVDRRDALVAGAYTPMPTTITAGTREASRGCWSGSSVGTRRSSSRCTSSATA